MMTPEENDLLCRVEGDAPMGQIMRRHWIAACLSEEVAEPDGAPVKVRLLGEDLVVFPRQQRPRRRARRILLAPARVAAVRAQRGMRPALPLSRLEIRRGRQRRRDGVGAGTTASSSERVKHKAYPTREAGGFVWTYMGPPEDMREFEPPAFAPTPDARVSATKVRVRCNWAQILEGQIDSAHSSQPAFVRHGAGAGRRRQGDRSELAAALDRQGAALPDRADQLRIPLCGDPAADQERGRRTITSARRSTSRPSRR